MSDPNTIDEIVKTHWAIMQAMQASTRPEWIELNMTMAQVKTLFVLAQEDGTPVSKVADYLGIGQPSASQLVDKLVRGGFAERSEGVMDRRITLVRLSDKGEQLVQRLYQGGEEQYRAWVSQLAPDDLAALLRGLQALAAVAYRSDQPASG